MSTETSHFWVGKFNTENDFFNFFGENENFYDDEEENNDELYISEFSKSQNETWIDHDFFECGFENDSNKSFEEKFLKYSYAKEWIKEVKQKLNNLNILHQVNVIAFITKEKISSPSTLKTDKFEFIYIGEIEYSKE